MKITFISPKFHNVWEPLGIGYIKSYCDKNAERKHEWKFFHGNFCDEDDMILEASKSDLVAFSCTTSTFQDATRIANEIKSLSRIWSSKQYSPRMIMGGWHPTTLRKVDNDIFQGAFFGEGEQPFCNALDNFKDAFFSTNVRRFKAFPLEFSELPWPDREFIQQDKFLDLCEKQCGERILSFQSRRGCMMNCAMCGERCMSSKGVRYRDSDDLLDEIENVFSKYNGTMFKFVDPTWSYPKFVAKEFCKKKILRNSFKWEAMVHASFLDEELMTLMMHSNCKQMNVGCESGSQRILNDMRKGTTVNRIKKVFKIGKDLGIQMRAFFMIGLPNETEKDIELTKQLIRDIEPDVLGVSILCPLPGTDFYRDEFEDKDWSKVDEYNSFWSTIHFSNEELYKIQKEIYTEFKNIVVGHQKYKISG